MMYVVVDIADMQVTDQPDDILVTYSLGSCLGVTLYDPVAKVGGMLHSMLPLSKIDPAKAQANPYMFTDTGVSALLQKLFDMGATRKNLIAKVAGGASLLDEKKLFNIGERNYKVLEKIFEKNGIPIRAKDVGSTRSRTLFLYMENGIVTVKSGGNEVEL